MSNWIRNPDGSEPLRVSFRVDAHRDEAIYTALSKLPFRAGGAFARYAVGRALATGLVNVDDFMGTNKAEPARPGRPVRAARQPAPAQPAAAAIGNSGADVARVGEVREAGAPISSEEIGVMQALQRF